MLREIDERRSDNIRVTLYWDDEGDTLTVEVEDYRDPGCDITISGVPTADRREAFLHPYAYKRKAEA